MAAKKNRPYFLSPARSIGEGGFPRQDFVRRPASRLLVGVKMQKLLVIFFKHDIPSNMGMSKWFFKDATKIQNSRQGSTPNFFVCAKTLKLKVRNYLNFTITLPTIWRCAGDFLKVFLKFKIAAMDELHIYNHIAHHLEMCRLFLL